MKCEICDKEIMMWAEIKERESQGLKFYSHKGCNGEGFFNSRQENPKVEMSERQDLSQSSQTADTQTNKEKEGDKLI